MSDFKAKMLQIRFPLRSTVELTALPQNPYSCISRGLLLRGGEGKEGRNGKRAEEKGLMEVGEMEGKGEGLTTC